MQYVKAVPGVDRTSPFNWKKLVAKLRREEWLALTPEESKALCGVKHPGTACAQAFKFGTLKQKVVWKSRGTNGAVVHYGRLY